MASVRIVAPGRNIEPLWCQVEGCGATADYAALAVVENLTIAGLLVCRADLPNVLDELNELADRHPDSCSTLALRLP